MRMVPAGFSRNSLKAASSASISSNRGPTVSQQSFAGFGWGDAACRARQKANAKARFELAHGLAQRRLRDPELRCRFREASFPPHRDQGPQIIDVGARHS